MRIQVSFEVEDNEDKAMDALADLYGAFYYTKTVAGCFEARLDGNEIPFETLRTRFRNKQEQQKQKECTYLEDCKDAGPFFVHDEKCPRSVLYKA